MTGTVLSVLLVLLALAVVALALLLRGHADLSRFEPLRNPAVRPMPSQRMLVCESVGDPAKTGGAAIKRLFRAWYGLRGHKGPPVLRARWPRGLDTPRDAWVGVYAMPLPDGVSELPPAREADGPPLRLDTWEYGDVAEILHVGPYSAEPPTIERLHAFIRDSGLRIAGDHEEEYVRGPGMFGPGNPERYYTVIRYRVARA